jgi:threonine aldolase
VTIGDFLAELRKRRVLALAPFGGIRMVTHKDIDDEDVDRAIAAFKEILG